MTRGDGEPAPGGIADRVRKLAATRADDPAVLDGPACASWGSLDAAVDAAAEAFSPGEVAPLEVEADLPGIVRVLAARRAGAIPALLPARMTTGERAAALALLLGHAPPAGTALIVMTSGTTGRPKGVAHSEASLLASADAWRAVLPAATGWLLALGLAHVAGLGVLWRAVIDGVPVRIAAGAATAALLDAMRDPAVSHASLVPTQLGRLLDLGGDAPPPPNLRAVPLGGGTIPASLVRRAAVAGWPVWPTYGLSEMGSGATALPFAEAASAPDSAGRALPGVTVAVEAADADGVGEIVVAGPSALLGYLGEEPRAAGEPFRTGDLGRLDADGRLFVVDRRTDRIVRGGENIAPAEVEAALLEHPAVADSGVVARRDEALGHVPVAAIVLRSDAPHPADAELAAFIRARLAGFKVPDAFVRLDTLPRTPSGKLRRADLRALIDNAPEGQFERPGGDRIGWRITGDGPRPIVLLHGTLSSARQLDLLARELADGCDATVHALDRRGSGRGRLGNPRPLDVALHVADLIAYLDARGIAQMHTVGLSFGGVLALETAARHPERVASVTAYEPPYGSVVMDAPGVDFPDPRPAMLAAYAERGPAGAAETFMRAVAGDEAWDRLPDRSRAFLEAEGVSAVADGTLLGLDPEGLARITAPTLLLTGGASEAFYPPVADELARRIPGALRATLDGLTHTAPIVRPNRVADAVRDLLERTAR